MLQYVSTRTHTHTALQGSGLLVEKDQLQPVTEETCQDYSRSICRLCRIQLSSVLPDDDWSPTTRGPSFGQGLPLLPHR